MSDENLWGEENEPFNDVPDEVQIDSNGVQASAPPVRLQRPTTPTAPKVPQPPPQFEDVSIGIVSNAFLDSEEDGYEDAMADAHLRLEQGSLYKMIMNHDLFEGVDADPKAVQNVTNEMRKFARERMEVMLGMRKETTSVEHLEIDFPFNSLEVDVLKKLAFTATKGATQNSDNYVPEVRRTTEEVPNVPRKTLKPIGGIKKPTQTQPSRPLQTKASAPVQRSKMDLTIDQIAREEGIPRELLEETAPGVGGKPIHEMTEQEIIERNKLASQRRGKQVKSAGAIPMATEQQQEMLAQSQVGSLGQSPLMKGLIEAVKKMPIKNP